MNKTLLALAFAFLSSASFTAQANEESVKKALDVRFPGKVESVQRTPFAGLYEAHVGADVIYTDEAVSYLIDGQLIDFKSMKNLTQESANRYNAQLYAKLPLDLAAKTVKGNGKRTLVTFEDPNCGYCKRLAQDIGKLENVTIYTFLYPILGDDSVQKSKTIWCAADRGKVWMDWMLAGKLPIVKADCTWPKDRLMELGQKFHVNGTPALLFADGEMIPGAIPLDKIKQKLAEVGK